MTLIGNDPHRDQYPPEWLGILPARLRGRYDPPGWTGNGIAPWGLTHGWIQPADAAGRDDVVLLRIDGLALMTLHGALPELRIEERPQCHIVAIAKEAGQVAASVGCALSRARTGMKASEMTCAIPGALLRPVLERVEATSRLDRQMARYAAADARRFS